MAAPATVTTKALSGKFIVNKSLSDDTDELLKLQGVSWVKRRAIATLSINLVVKHTTNAAGVEHVDVDQTLLGYFSSRDSRTLDWQEREFTDEIFGILNEKSRRIPAKEITDEFLKQGWTQDTFEDDIIFTDTWSSPGKNTRTWRALQAWGFAMVDGKRRYVGCTTFTSSEKADPIHVRFVYDYIGSL